MGLVKLYRNDRIEVNLSMEVQKVRANPLVAGDAGKIALQRGPLIYCAEWKDNGGGISGFIVPAETALTAEYRKDLLQGVTVLQGKALNVDVDADGRNVGTTGKELTAIPYYAWANRGAGEMTVWFPEKIRAVELITK